MTGKGEKQKGDETQLPAKAVVRVRACAPASRCPGAGGWDTQSILPPRPGDLGQAWPACSILLPGIRLPVLARLQRPRVPFN